MFEAGAIEGRVVKAIVFKAFKFKIGQFEAAENEVGYAECKEHKIIEVA